jgi:hypothetical protein
LGSGVAAPKKAPAAVAAVRGSQARHVVIHSADRGELGGACQNEKAGHLPEEAPVQAGQALDRFVLAGTTDLAVACASEGHCHVDGLA